MTNENNNRNYIYIVTYCYVFHEKSAKMTFFKKEIKALVRDASMVMSGRSF